MLKNMVLFLLFLGAIAAIHVVATTESSTSTDLPVFSNSTNVPIASYSQSQSTPPAETSITRVIPVSSVKIDTASVYVSNYKDHYMLNFVVDFNGSIYLQDNNGGNLQSLGDLLALGDSGLPILTEFATGTL